MEFINNFVDLFQLNFKFIIPLLMLAVIDLILGLTKGHYIEGISSAKMKQTIKICSIYRIYAFMLNS